MVILAGCGRLSFEDHRDGGNKDAGSQPQTCNAITKLADDFAADRRSERWARSYTDDTSSIAIANHQVTLNISVNAANSYVGLVSSKYYDLRGQRVFAGLVHPGNPKTTGGLGVGIDKTTLAHVVVENGVLIAVREINADYEQVAMEPYDPVGHRYLAFEERAGRLYWETSADAVTFTSFYDEPAPFDLSLVETYVYAGLSTASADPGSAVFDSFNGGVAILSSACKATALVDSFDGTNALWENSFADACCTTTESNGQVVLSTNGKAGFAGLRSSAGYDLRDSQIYTATKGPQQSTTMYGLLGAEIDVDNYIVLELDGAGYTCETFTAGVLQQDMAVHMAGDAYVRLREAAGTVFYEASPDAMTWRTLVSRPTPFDVSDVYVGIEIGNGTDSTSANAVAYDSFNAP